MRRTLIPNCMRIAVCFVGLTASVFALPAFADDAEDKLETAVGCSAYAFIQTRSYPETVKIYQENERPSNAAEKARARTGMIWTNRVFFTGQVGGVLFREARGRPATNGDISALRQQLVAEMTDLSDQQKSGLLALCKPLYDQADKYCATNLCVAKP